MDCSEECELVNSTQQGSAVLPPPVQTATEDPTLSWLDVDYIKDLDVKLEKIPGSGKARDGVSPWDLAASLKMIADRSPSPQTYDE